VKSSSLELHMRTEREMMQEVREQSSEEFFSRASHEDRERKDAGGKGTTV